MEEEQEETYTYRIRFGVATMYINSEVTETLPLEDFGYSDQEWDELDRYTKDKLLAEWEHEWALQNIEYWGEVLSD